MSDGVPVVVEAVAKAPPEVSFRRVETAAMRSGLGLGLAAALAVLGLGLAPCADERKPPVAAPHIVDCRFAKMPSFRSNEVHIASGATCAEARQLIRFGPTLGEFKRHPVASVSDDPRIAGDWVCEAERSAFRAPTADVLCEDIRESQKRVAYLLP